MNDLFYELTHVFIGVSRCLSKTPTNEEWKQLYDMAKKQSLVGICFAGVQQLCNSDEEYYASMNELQYLKWMGMAAKNQQ